MKCYAHRVQLSRGMITTSINSIWKNPTLHKEPYIVSTLRRQPISKRDRFSSLIMAPEHLECLSQSSLGI